MSPANRPQPHDEEGETEYDEQGLGTPVRRPDPCPELIKEQLELLKKYVPLEDWEKRTGSAAPSVVRW
jgi:hypothetical protein